MGNLERRLEKLEEERTPDLKAIRWKEELRAKIERGRERVLAHNPDHKFYDEPLGPTPLLPNGKLDIAAVLERVRQRARERLRSDK